VLGVALGLTATYLLTFLKKTSGLVQGEISMWAICEGICDAIAIALIGAAYPAYSCSRLPIADTLRAS
jgi:ABC-type lipoprotein release transport system permease subunit